MLFREKRSCFRNGNSARIKNGIEYSVSQRNAFPNTCQFIKLFLSGESQTDTLQMLLWFHFFFVGCRRCIYHFSGGWYHPPESRQPVKNWGEVRGRSYRSVRSWEAGPEVLQTRGAQRYLLLKYGWSAGDSESPHTENRPEKSVSPRSVPDQVQPESQYKPAQQEMYGFHQDTRTEHLHQRVSAVNQVDGHGNPAVNSHVLR